MLAQYRSQLEEHGIDKDAYQVQMALLVRWMNAVAERNARRYLSLAEGPMDDPQTWIDLACSGGVHCVPTPGALFRGRGLYLSPDYLRAERSRVPDGWAVILYPEDASPREQCESIVHELMHDAHYNLERYILPDDNLPIWYGTLPSLEDLTDAFARCVGVDPEMFTLSAEVFTPHEYIAWSLQQYNKPLSSQLQQVLGRTAAFLNQHNQGHAPLPTESDVSDEGSQIPGSGGPAHPGMCAPVSEPRPREDTGEGMLGEIDDEELRQYQCFRRAVDHLMARRGQTFLFQYLGCAPRVGGDYQDSREAQLTQWAEYHRRRRATTKVHVGPCTPRTFGLTLYASQLLPYGRSLTEDLCLPDDPKP